MRLVFLPALSIALCVTLAASARPVHHKSRVSTIHSTTARASVRRVSAHSASRRAKTHVKAIAAKPILAMDPARATAIQTALIKQGYLSGEASGNWDAESFAAMQKLQGDNGWQTKIVPDSRALIKLGLGPTATPVPTPN